MNTSTFYVRGSTSYNSSVVDEIDLKKIAVKLATYVKKNPQPLIIYLIGHLGAGKTSFAREFISVYGFNKVKSPTYSIVESYPLYVRGSTSYINHFDCYRLTCPKELEEMGLRDYLTNNICLFEWPEKAIGVIPDAQISIELHDHKNFNQRQLSISTNQVEFIKCLELS